MKNFTEFIPSVTSNTRPPKLLDQLRRCIRDKHYSLRTEDAYVYWARWFIRFHGLRHPAEMGAAEVQAFLSYLANERKVAASTHKQALCALLFLYKQVLQMELPWMEQLHWPNRPPRRPTVLTPAEVDALLGAMSGTYALIARLLYGTGMRLMECMTLRIKDLDFERREITVRNGKGDKDRMTVLPLSLVAPLRDHLATVRALFDDDRTHQRTGVMLPDALERKYTRAAIQWGWYWVFPSDHESTDPRSGVIRRHHMYEQTVQRAIKRAVTQANIAKPASTHTLRHYPEFGNIPRRICWALPQGSIDEFRAA
jgi:integron integrase